MLVTLGLGSVVASAVSTAPWLATLSRHKVMMFAASGTLLALNYWLVAVRPQRCSPGTLCHPDTAAMRFNRRVFYVSVAMYVMAAVITFGPPLTGEAD